MSNAMTAQLLVMGLQSVCDSRLHVLVEDAVGEQVEELSGAEKTELCYLVEGEIGEVDKKRESLLRIRDILSDAMKEGSSDNGSRKV